MIGYPLQILHKVSQQPGNHVNISFQGNREDVLFECLLLDSVDIINPCKSKNSVTLFHFFIFKAFSMLVCLWFVDKQLIIVIVN